MSDRLSPGPEAKARIQGVSQKQLQAFFDEVPATAMQRVARLLPRVDGFRKTSKAGIIRQKEALARRLSRSSAQAPDYNGLYTIWRTWIDEHLSNSELIHELIDDVEEAANNADGPEARRLAIEEQVASLLEKLKEESQQNRCTREQIDRLFTFSPFPETAAARLIINAAKSAADVERDATLDKLPIRLRQDENEIQLLKSELKTLADRFDPLATEVAQALAELPKLRSTVEQATLTAESARNAVQEMASAVPAEQRPPDEEVAVQARVNAIAEDVERLRSEARDAASVLVGLPSLQRTVEQLAAERETAAKDALEHTQRVDAVASALEETKRDVTALLEDRTQADRLEPLARQLADIERRIETAEARPPLPAETKDLSGHRNGSAPPAISSSLRCETLGAMGTAAAIQSHAALANAFANALQVLGLRKTSAQVLAEECTAAVASRQAVFFQGAFATRAARALARVVGGQTCARLAIPIGIQDGEDMRRAIDAGLGAHEGNIAALAIEGINRAALDITRDVIADCIDPVSETSNAATGRIAVFAALSRGLASLPIEPEYIALGPVFDLDYLDWRTTTAAVADLAPTYLSAEAEAAIQAQVASVNANTEEAIRLTQRFVGKRNPSVERTIARAYQALHLVRTQQQSVTPLHSLFYGWLLPYWRALDLPREDIDDEVDGGKVHGAPVDARVAAMFEAEFPARGKPDDAR